MKQVRQKHLEYYWTTSNDLHFTELQKVEGNVSVNEKGFIFGIVKDRNNLHSKDHVICGMQNESHVILVDVRSFDFLNPVELDFQLDSTYGEAIAKTSTVAYMKVPTTNSKVVFSESKTEDLNDQSLLEHYYAWLKDADPASIYFLQKIIHLFTECLVHCHSEEAELQEQIFQSYLRKVVVLYGEDKIDDKETIVLSPVLLTSPARLKKIG